MYSSRHTSRLKILVHAQWRAITSLQQVRRNQNMRGRILAPVGAEIIHVPERELVDYGEGPSGRGGDMAVKKRPIG